MLIGGIMNIEDIRLTKNCQFFVPKQRIIKSEILDIMDAAADNKAAGRFMFNKIREKGVLNSRKYYYSLRVFTTERPVYFIDDSFVDLIHAYILIIEMDGHLVVFQKSCAKITDILQKKCNLIKNRQILNSFSDEETAFKKINMKNMTISTSGIRNKSFQAHDLNGVLSPYSLNKAVPNYLQIETGGALKSLTPTTGRIAELSPRIQIDQILEWTSKQILLLTSSSFAVKKNFLDQFAQPIELKEVLNESEPMAILIETDLIYERLGISKSYDSNVSPIYYKKLDGTNVVVSEKVLKYLYQYLGRVYPIENNMLKINDIKILKKYFPKGASANIKINNKSISIQCGILSRFSIHDNGKHVTLVSLINESKGYSICFSDPQYMYYAGNCFKSSIGKANIDAALKIFEIKPALTNVNCEKGLSFAPTQSAFDANSIFGVVESIFLAENDDYIFCDDLGNEWADHICLNLTKKRIAFIHSKFNSDISNSASRLHDVISQAVKNLGNMFFTKEAFKKKLKNHHAAFYKQDHVTTQIATIRKPTTPDITDMLTKIEEELLAGYDTRRVCVLSCSFLSLGEIKISFKKILDGDRVEGHKLQLFWLIMSFIHSAKEMNVEPKIFCCS